MKKITGQQIKDSFSTLVLKTSGPLDAEITGISAIENIQPGSLIFVTQEKFLKTAADSVATAVLAPVSWENKIPSDSRQLWLLSKNPELAMASIKNKFFLATPYRAPQKELIHATAVIAASARIASTAQIGPRAVIGDKVVIGENSFIGAGAVVEAGTTIGDFTTIHPLAYIGHSTVIGNHCEVLPQASIATEGYGYAHDEKGNHYRIPHSGRVILEDHVHVGANTAIDRGTIEDSVIGAGTKIDNQCHLAHNSVLGKNCLITAQFGMAGSSKIGNNFITGGKTSVTGHIEITDNVQVAGMSGVTKSIDEPGAYGGFPLQKLQDYLKTKAALAQLADLRKQVASLLKSNGGAN